MTLQHSSPLCAGNLKYATPRTLRDFGYPVKDREDRGLGKRDSQGKCKASTSQPPRTRSGKTQPGGRSLRRTLTRLSVREAAYQLACSRQNYTSGETRPGSRKP